MTESAASSEAIVAPPAKAYRLRFIIMFLVFVGMGVWFGYDGFVGYPAENAARQAQPDYKLGDPLPRTPMDMLFQKVLMVALPIIGIALLAWCLARSRGEYRLEGTTLHIPGHPPIDLNSIRTINRKYWDRKGLAYLSYEQGDKSGTIRIDDFAYQRGPTDEIFARIEKYLLPAGTSGE
ncbi:MAG TPA: hypothetical protein VG722_05665 [Tepidisphaeraceae bacterium]|nr:hypothetical protein [Tepidisphaeraceae bacterium]